MSSPNQDLALIFRELLNKCMKLEAEKADLQGQLEESESARIEAEQNDHAKEMTIFGLQTSLKGLQNVVKAQSDKIVQLTREEKTE